MLHRARRMDFPALVKPRSGFRVDPNLREYEAVRASFSWREAAKALDGLPAGGLNIAHEAVDRHAAGARCDHPALVFLGKHGEKRTIDTRFPWPTSTARSRPVAASHSRTVASLPPVASNLPSGE